MNRKLSTEGMQTDTCKHTCSYCMAVFSHGLPAAYWNTDYTAK